MTDNQHDDTQTENTNTSDTSGENQEDPFVDDNAEPDTAEYGVPIDDEQDDAEAEDEATDGQDDGKDEGSKPPAKKVQKPTKNNQGLNAVNEYIITNKVKGEVESFFTKNPEAAPYRGLVERWVNHPNRMKFIKAGVPVNAFIAEALAPHQQKIGARKAKAADSEARNTSGGGASVPVTAAGEVDYSKMSAAQITELARKVQNGQHKQ